MNHLDALKSESLFIPREAFLGPAPFSRALARRNLEVRAARLPELLFRVGPFLRGSAERSPTTSGR